MSEPYIEAEPDEPDDYDPPCCATPQAAARNLCGCWGTAAGGTWIGSAT